MNLVHIVVVKELIRFDDIVRFCPFLWNERQWKTDARTRGIHVQGDDLGTYHTCDCWKPNILPRLPSQQAARRPEMLRANM